jgi:hypothetical protein
VLNDVLAIQSIYGESTSRTDNTLYGFSNNITGAAAAFTISPSTKSDSYDLRLGRHGYPELQRLGFSCTINLEPGAYSSYAT